MNVVRPSLRTVLFFVFLITSIVPVLLLGWWVIDTAKFNEYKAVEEKHLLVAKNVTLALSRYSQDTLSILNNFHFNPKQTVKTPYLNLLRSQNITTIRTFDSEGETLMAINTISGKEPPELTDKQLETIAGLSRTEKLKFLPIQLNSEGAPRILIVGIVKRGGITLVAEMNSHYISQIQNDVKFGKLGHAAIVDQNGNVIAHPKAQWVSQVKNISKVSAVKRMMNKETGVEQFYSPAKKEDMIAGFSYVKETGWGVMVPQPISELDENIEYIKYAVLNVSLVGILLSMLISWFLANKLAQPTIQLANLTKQLKSNEGLKEPFLIPAFTLEQQELSDSFNEMVIAIHDKNTELLYNSQHDPLTNLANRNLLRSHLSQKIVEKKPFIFILLDLNDFKEINDHWSHAHGDETLKYVAERLLETVGSQGLVTRIGGDEFAIVLNSDITKYQAEELTVSIRASLTLSYQVLTETLKIDCSCGLACFPVDADNLSDLMQCSDLAMYDAKNETNSHIKWFHSRMRLDLDQRVELTQALREAIKLNQFVIHYQPKVDPDSFEIQGFEALVRWGHPTKGLLFPGTFISLAENTALIIPIGELIVDQVCQDIIKFRDNNRCVPIAINLSAVQFDDLNLVEMIKKTLLKYEVDVDCIEFEITESAITGPIDKLVNKISDAGFDVSIDDFGTGESSLARIRDFNIKNIKIDKSFIDNLEEKPKDYDLFKSMVSIAHTLDLNIIVEGVERRSQLDMIQSLNCTSIQGFLFSPGVDIESALVLLDKGKIKPLR